MADTTHAALRAHMERWRSKGQPGFNTGTLDDLKEQIRWLCQRIDAARDAVANTPTMRAVRKLRERKVERG